MLSLALISPSLLPPLVGLSYSTNTPRNWRRCRRWSGCWHCCAIDGDTGGSGGIRICSITPDNSLSAAARVKELGVESTGLAVQLFFRSPRVGFMVFEGIVGTFAKKSSSNKSRVIVRTNRRSSMRRVGIASRLRGALPSLHKQVGDADDNHDERNYRYPIHSHMLLHITVAHARV